MLVTVCEKDKCAGCMACLSICSQGAISIQDTLFNYNALIDSSKCIRCNACHRICQQNNKPFMMKTQVWYQGWAEDENTRLRSSSGGIAAAISSNFIQTGGIVCSCCFADGAFSFSFAEDEEDLEKFKGSKYVKSNPTNIYNTILSYLSSGRKVLFVGLPCQVAAVIKYVGEKYKDLLFTVDLICHGTPSPRVLDIYFEQKGLEIHDVRDIRFRQKNQFQVLDDRKTLGTPGVMDSYTIGFLNGLFYTDNCYSCQYATEMRVSDLTIGDSWGSTLSNNERNKGISLIMCQTNKGLMLIKQPNIHLEDVDSTKAIERNQQLSRPSRRPKQRKNFLNALLKGEKIDSLIFKYYPKQVAKQMVKKALIQMKLMRGGHIVSLTRVNKSYHMKMWK